MKNYFIKSIGYIFFIYSQILFADNIVSYKPIMHEYAKNHITSQDE
jgi:hypothetical protein